MKAKAHQKAGNANRPGLKLHWAHSDTLTLTPSTHLSEGLAQADRRQYQRVGAFQNLASQGISRHTTDHHRLNKGEKTRLNDAEWCWMFRTEEVTIATWSSAESEKRSAWSRLLEPCQNLQKPAWCWGLARNSKLPQTQKDRLRSVLPPNVRLAKFKLFNKEVRLILNDVFEWSWVMWGDFCFCDFSLFAPASGGTG